jgi:uncharacterized protein YndB with AHSA1/START domain
MPVYHFTTHWEFTAPIEKVWQELTAAKNWPQWWRCWKEARPLETSGELKVGSALHNAVRGRLPYSLRFTTTIAGLEPPYWLELDSTGDLVGTGRWELEEKNGGTSVTYYWDVGTTNRLLNALSGLKFVKSMIEDNHHYVMQQGYEGLKNRLAPSSG